VLATSFLRYFLDFELVRISWFVMLPLLPATVTEFIRVIYRESRFIDACFLMMQHNSVKV